MTLSPWQWPEAAATVARTFGVRGAALRAVHEARRRGGRFRPAPRHTVAPMPDRGTPLFPVNADVLAAATSVEAAVERAERVAHGEYEAFRSTWRRLPDDASGWHVNPLTRSSRPASLTWWNTHHLDPASGDIKDLWEPARFGWSYDLVRAFLVTGDDRYAAAFHARFAEWAESSPPFRGAHWSCGQETAIRAVALLYAEANLASAPSSGAEQMRRIAAVLAASGERIADAIGYAISQRNNHAISEAVGLVVLGARFRGSHPEADRWLREGTRLVERLVGEQFAEDGWYIQHSFTYMRLALDQLVVAARALRAVGEEFPVSVHSRIRAAVGLLTAVIDPATGVVPNHGANDGAFVHPITLAAYRDFRSVLTAVCATFGIPYPAGVPVDAEVLAWLGIRDVPNDAAVPDGTPVADGVRVGSSGWATARVGGTVVFLRAGHYTSRPGHLDPLHVDVRFGAQEAIVDPGTFAYNAAPPWRNGLASAMVHNGPVLDGVEPGVRGPRFLWYLWPSARITSAGYDQRVAVLVAEVDGRLRRTVRVTAEQVTVEDELLQSAGTVAIGWLLHPDADSRAVRVSVASQLLAANEHSTAGWFSPHYGERIATRYVEVVHPATCGLRIISDFTRSANAWHP